MVRFVAFHWASSGRLDQFRATSNAIIAKNHRVPAKKEQIDSDRAGRSCPIREERYDEAIVRPVLMAASTITKNVRQSALAFIQFFRLSAPRIHSERGPSQTQTAMWKDPKLDRPGWLCDMNAMLISALCHLAVFVALGLVTLSADVPWTGIRLKVIQSSGEMLTFDETDVEEQVPLRLKVSTETVAESLSDGMELSQLEVDSNLPQTLGKSLTMAAIQKETEAGFVERLGRASSTEFFGIGGYGQMFVYVVDASDSMNERGKFRRACYELLHSIEQLGPEQHYFIVFYNDVAHPMDETEPVPASQEQLARTRQWVESVSATGGTNPLPALLLALSLRPDAVYFLSDGQFDPQATRAVRNSNRPNRRTGSRTVPIHTISFADRTTIGLMKTIARNSHGEHRFVP